MSRTVRNRTAGCRARNGQREQRRAAVLEVARGIFAQKGYHATSIDDIIEAAGIARGTFYLYFESKRAIFDELLDELFATLQAQVHRIDVGPGAAPPVEQMNATVDRVLQTLLENREMARILLREAVGIDDEFDASWRDFYGRIEALIVERDADRTEDAARAQVRRRDGRALRSWARPRRWCDWAFVERDPTPARSRGTSGAS